MSSSEGTRAHAHPNTIARHPSPSPAPALALGPADADGDATADRRPPSWDEDVTRPGDPSDLAVLASATIASVVTPLPPPPLPPPPPRAAAVRVETDRTVMIRVSPRDRRRPLIAVAAVSALGGFVAGYLLRGGGSSAAASILPPAEATAPSVRAPAIAPPAAPQPAIAPAPTPARCRARFTDAPDGAAVQWGDVALGVTPFAGDTDVPCGDATVVLTHPRYERLERVATASAGAPTIVDAGMKRPLGTLELRSVPAGATFTIDGAAVDPGAGPVKVRAFTQVSIVAELRGYATSTRRVYVHGPHDSVVVQLAPAGHRR